jgi:hypothetical protein
MGIGNGNVFQPTIISLQAHSPKSQRAVIISIRNFLRCLGGAVGLAVSAAILQNVLRSSLPAEFQYLAKSTYAKPNYANFSDADAEVIKNAYEKASHTVFLFYAPVAAICLVTCIFVKDRGLQRQEDIDAEHERSRVEAEQSQASSKADLHEESVDVERAQSMVSFESHLKTDKEDDGDQGTVLKASLADSSREKLPV